MTKLNPVDVPSETTLVTCYQELCNTYRAIDDFRAKLLALLPFATGLGIFALLGKSEADAGPYLGPIGAFGFVVTLGLFAYELFGIRKCHALIKAGTRIEVHWLGIEDGQFVRRPHSLFGFVDEPFAAGIVYPGVMASWLYLALLPDPAAAWLAAGLVFAVGFLGMLGYDVWLRFDGKRFRRKLEDEGEAVPEGY